MSHEERLLLRVPALYMRDIAQYLLAEHEGCDDSCIWKRAAQKDLDVAQQALDLLERLENAE